MDAGFLKVWVQLFSETGTTPLSSSVTATLSTADATTTSMADVVIAWLLKIVQDQAWKNSRLADRHRTKLTR